MAEELIFGGHRLRVSTNLRSVLKGQMLVSELFEEILQDAPVPIGELIEKISKLEKSLKQEFVEETF